MYVAVKGGEKAIAEAHRLLARERRGQESVPELSLDQIREQLSLSVDRVMSEGSLYDPILASLAVKQARGDLMEAIFLLRAYRTTLPRFGYSQPVDTSRMHVRRRISATFKDVPGGQVLGPTFDYTHRLLDWELAGNCLRKNRFAPEPASETARDATPETTTQMKSGATAGTMPSEISDELMGATPEAMPRVLEVLGREGIIESEGRGDDPEPDDLTREPLTLPAGRSMRLQNLARADEGFLLAMGYSTQRGFGNSHPFVGEIRMGELEVEFVPEELGFAVTIGEMTMTECETVNQFIGSGDARFTRGYGLTFGQGERKAMSMALVDRSLRAEELGEEVRGPAQDEEFVLYHSDNVEASGFVQHLKLPHYVDFQSELALVRGLRQDAANDKEDGHER
ncbi:alpha-D-ribose 1-methylphosphonate 5-triphosphate synthase subunit PhnI [Desulfomicrobium macestii]|uniref:Alpha-D-ribose 1-methylphosphonate 5-triphosphate synthase subunit PhnI n=2 Tax=Desulfomicrobium TaxID=898 RepID=A0A8G2F5I4_DESNO|nr:MULTISPECIES: carbon-phosphorus lyase complex subunit PhnI [Desulfomicrobium]MBE1425029.1 alpha-D-ribose 1-methylphosphonate 5-triphosphate synthase subunit PhnI [Desulfomicrobium macestii]SFM03481.1 alpha-D-ribose 1-methylphosphonate 5-triphosphate synthase subunit PhnI [Desulfomicrobium norvegicum]